jgi:hypothetical protein
LGPEFVGAVRLEGASLDVTLGPVSYCPAPSGDFEGEPRPVLFRGGANANSIGLGGLGDPISRPTCRIDHWERWLMIEDYGAPIPAATEAQE